MKTRLISLLLLTLFSTTHALADSGLDVGPARYQQHCAACHGPDRLGGMGPALLPESLARLKSAEAQKVITQGRTATQMNGFAQTLSAAEIQAVVQHIYQPVSPAPSWSEKQIQQ